jgi:hypothetical protein
MNKSKEQLLAEEYFRLSNLSDFDSIAKLFTDSTTYSSQNTGVFLGSDSILEMQKDFHGKFTKLNWKVNFVEELKPGVILFDYTFEAEANDGKKINYYGLEYVIVREGKIVHIEIRNK